MYKHWNEVQLGILDLKELKPERQYMHTHTHTPQLHSTGRDREREGDTFTVMT